VFTCFFDVLLTELQGNESKDGPSIEQLLGSEKPTYVSVLLIDEFVNISKDGQSLLQQWMFVCSACVFDLN
jgi:hypothetical protein